MQSLAAHSLGPALYDVSDLTKEPAEKIADTVSSLQVERGGLDGDKPRRGGSNQARLIELVRLYRNHRYK